MAFENYQPNEAGYRKMALSPDILKACVAEATKGMAFAKGISPNSEAEDERRNDASESAYVNSFEVTTATLVGVFRGGPRHIAILRNNSKSAAAVEFGNKRVKRPRRVIGRTAAYLGKSGAARQAGATRAASRAAK